QAVAAIEARMRRLLGDDRLFTEQEPEAVRKAEQQLSDLQVQNAKVLLAVPRNTRMADRRRADEDALRAEVERQRGVAPDRLSTADQLIYRQLADDRYDLRSELAQAIAAQDADQQALAGLGVGVWAEARGPAARRVRDLSLARSSEPLPDQPRHRA